MKSSFANKLECFRQLMIWYQLIHGFGCFRFEMYQNRCRWACLTSGITLRDSYLTWDRCEVYENTCLIPWKLSLARKSRNWNVIVYWFTFLSLGVECYSFHRWQWLGLGHNDHSPNAKTYIWWAFLSFTFLLEGHSCASIPHNRVSTLSIFAHEL